MLLRLHVCVCLCASACVRACVCVLHECACCTSVRGAMDVPQSADELGKLQQAGVYWQSELALGHGQLAIIK